MKKKTVSFAPIVRYIALVPLFVFGIMSQKTEQVEQMPPCAVVQDGAFLLHIDEESGDIVKVEGCFDRGVSRPDGRLI